LTFQGTGSAETPARSTVSLVFNFCNGLFSPVNFGYHRFFIFHIKNTELFGDLWSLSFSAIHESQVFFFGHVSKVVHGFIGTGDFSSSVLGIVLLSLGQILVEDGLTADFFQW
jgi:hypothetical protein